MKIRGACLLMLLGSGVMLGQGVDDAFDRFGDALTWSARQGAVRAHASGTFDLEGYALPDPAPGVIDADSRRLFNPRLTFFLDAQMGEQLYGFVQARADRGFDPANEPLRARVDEYALRWTSAGSGRVSVQVGKFATVVGNWTVRHLSWSNPFITAPLPYENLTGIWDSEPVHSSGQLLAWSHVRGQSTVVDEKYVRLPILWGPSYATGAMVAGEARTFRYALEVKSASLSSRPQAWTLGEARSDTPTVSGRLGWRPDEAWDLGLSMSAGSYLRPSAGALLPSSRHRAQYRELVVGHDLAYAWHHLEVWAEIYAARFAIPGIGNADTLAYYIETKYRFSPEWSGALRWNQQVYGTIPDRGEAVRWGRNVWRIDVGPAWRPASHVQLKVQYSLQRGDTDRNDLNQLAAAQVTVRF